MNPMTPTQALDVLEQFRQVASSPWNGAGTDTVRMALVVLRIALTPPPTPAPAEPSAEPATPTE